MINSGLIYNAGGHRTLLSPPFFYEGHLPTTYSAIGRFLANVTGHVISHFDVNGRRACCA